MSLVAAALSALVSALAFGWATPRLLDLLDWWSQRGELITAVLPAMGAGLAIGVVVWAKVTPSTADAYVIGLRDERYDVRSAPARLLALVSGVGLGVPMGYEGPAVYFGGALGAAVPQRRGWRERPAVLAAATAAVAMVIGAPVAAALFAVEVTRRGWPRRADALPLLVGAAAAWLVREWRDEPGGIVGVDPGATWWRLAIAAPVVAVTGALVGRWFVRIVRRAKERATARSTRRRLLGAVVPLLVVVPLAQWITGEPVLFGPGHHLVAWAQSGNRAGVLVLMIVFGLLVATMVRAGVVGGLFVPMVTLGATLGTLLDRTVLVGLTPGVAQLFGVCAVLAVAYGVPLTAVALALSRFGWSTSTAGVLVAVALAWRLGGTRSVSIHQG